MKKKTDNRFLEKYFFGSHKSDPWLTVETNQIPFVVFDLESTGGNPQRSGITEVCALIVKNGVVEDRFYSLVNPQMRIPPIVRKLTGIDNAMVKDAPLVDKVFPKFSKFVKDYPVVSHNCSGDLKFLRYFSQQTVAKDFENFFVCTHLLGSKFFPDSPNNTLGGLAKHVGIDVGDVHRAEDDALITKALFDCILQKLSSLKISKLRDVILQQEDVESMIRMGSPINIEDRVSAPGPGILELKNSGRVELVLCSPSFKKETHRLRSPQYLRKPHLKAICKADFSKYKSFNTVLELMVHLSKIQTLPVDLIMLPHKLSFLHIDQKGNAIECQVGKFQGLKEDKRGFIFPKAHLDHLLRVYPDFSPRNRRKFQILQAFQSAKMAWWSRFKFRLQSWSPPFLDDLDSVLNSMSYMLPHDLQGVLIWKGKKQCKVFAVKQSTFVEMPSFNCLDSTSAHKHLSSIRKKYHNLKTQPFKTQSSYYKVFVSLVFSTAFRRRGFFIPEFILNDSNFLKTYLQKNI